MVHAEEELAERVLDALDVAVCQIALVELTIRDALVDHPIHHRADRVRVLLGERSHRCLGAVGEHHDPGFLASRARTGIAERSLVRRLSPLLCDLEEVLHDAVAVVPRYHLADLRGQVIAIGER